MSPLAIRAVGVAAAAASSALLFTALPHAGAAPASDSQGYVDSTARCTTPDTAVLFGSTDTSRVAICKTSAGGYQYRGVRVRDGAKLVLTATSNGSGSYQAVNDGITYAVSSASLVISSGGSTVRTEAWVDFHGQQASSASTTTSGTPTSTPTSTTPTSTTPLPPPLPAEVGGSTR
ncbi:hypothetical protein ACXDF8_23030 [Mycolicibacterium sp. CBM1]